MSASHIDWHKKHSIGIASLNHFDDSSKKIIARREFVYCNTKNTIKAIDEKNQKMKKFKAKLFLDKTN